VTVVDAVKIDDSVISLRICHDLPLKRGCRLGSCRDFDPIIDGELFTAKAILDAS
jgi:hypothetical protein